VFNIPGRRLNVSCLRFNWHYMNLDLRKYSTLFCILTWRIKGRPPVAAERKQAARESNNAQAHYAVTKHCSHWQTLLFIHFKLLIDTSRWRKPIYIFTEHTVMQKHR
jgi:hypothetical protein